jgi:predicted ATPase
MTAEEKIVKIKEILNDVVGENYQRQPKEETKKELLQFTIAEIADCVADIEEMIHDIYDIVEE